MRVGMIFECGPDGADLKVCQHLAKKLKPEIEIVPITLDNKDKLINECAEKARDLIKIDKCDRVVIIWDLLPPQRGKTICRKREREDILSSLKRYEDEDKDEIFKVSSVFLVCIEKELEAWLLADNRAIESILSKPHRPVSIDRERHPERERNPKKRLNRIFYEKVGRGYSDLTDAERIVKAMPDLERIKVCETFVRFALKVADIRF